jgi:hypothetical protein
MVSRDEEALLERLVDLERLLDEDRRRPVRFQKPERQRQWEQELNRLRVELGLA